VRSPSTFRQRDLTAAVKAARKAGLEVGRVEIAKDGRISVVVGKAELLSEPSAENPWDEVLNGH
jgi:hypothetical protein